MKKYYLTLLALMFFSISLFAQQEQSKKNVITLLKQFSVPLNPSYNYYFISEVDCSTCVEKLLNQVIAKQDKKSLYLIYYTSSKKRIAFSSTVFKDFILKSHFYLAKDASLDEQLNKSLTIGRGPYFFNVSGNTLVNLKSYSLD
ncbi:hypothetical protein [Mucilaginibacter sp. FT3.2]|uniref:hypothetical protein n=1 Tax=Mucilaginibacter sp. FT3.2 TaxID=2723090 RepID=UPI00161312E7|nr:hypothetical protein [Mucilaginibacter sp. FT3.2]MBB6232726.1 hypothetical protein [Mucilaginibacter sp. FT3.2]